MVVVKANNLASYLKIVLLSQSTLTCIARKKKTHKESPSMTEKTAVKVVFGALASRYDLPV